MIFDLAVIGILYFAVLAWGSNELWAMGFISFTALVLLAARLIWDCWHGKVRLFAAWAFAPALLFLAFVALQRIRPTPALRAQPVSGPFTLEPYSTGLYLLLALAYLSLALLAANGFRSREQVRRLIFSILALGIFEAIYGMHQYLGRSNYIWDFAVSGTIARGTLINRNHYAFLLNVAICCGIGYLYYRSARFPRIQNHSARTVHGNPASAQLAWFILWLALMGLALVFSMSRMGIVAMLGCVATMIALGKVAGHGTPTTMMALALLCLISGLAVYTGVETVLARYETITRPDYFEKSRLPIWRDAWKMAKDQMIFGQGLGTFQWAFPAHESFEPDRPARYAHNDYLQALSEVGWTGLALIATAFAACLRIALRNLARSSDPLVQGIGLMTVGALSATMLQEITDFSLYIPAIAVLLTIVLGLNLRASALSAEGATGGTPPGVGSASPERRARSG